MRMRVDFLQDIKYSVVNSCMALINLNIRIRKFSKLL